LVEALPIFVKNRPGAHRRPLHHGGTSGCRFKGLVIAEAALFGLGKPDFAFGPVFKGGPALPLLKDSDCLQIR